MTQTNASKNPQQTARKGRKPIKSSHLTNQLITYENYAVTVRKGRIKEKGGFGKGSRWERKERKPGRRTERGGEGDSKNLFQDPEDTHVMHSYVLFKSCLLYMSFLFCLFCLLVMNLI